MKRNVCIVLVLIEIFLLASCTQNNTESNSDADIENNDVVLCAEVPNYGFISKESNNEEIKNNYKSVYRKAKNNKGFIIMDYKGGVCIVRYDGSDKNLIIPEKLEGKDVVGITGHFKTSYIGDKDEDEFSYTAYESAFSDSNVTVLTLPATVRYLEYNLFTDVEKINVSDNNKCFSSVDGILYNKDKTVLLCVPGKYRSKKVHIDSHTLVAYDVLSQYTEELFVGAKIAKLASLKSVYYGAEDEEKQTIIDSNSYTNLKKVVVSKKNKSYSSVDGVLYNKRQTILLAYPCNKSEKHFRVPESVEVIEPICIDSIRHIKSIYIGRGVKKIKAYYLLVDEFKEKPSLDTVYGYSDTAADKWQLKWRSKGLDSICTISLDFICLD